MGNNKQTQEKYDAAWKFANAIKWVGVIPDDSLGGFPDLLMAKVAAIRDKDDSKNQAIKHLDWYSNEVIKKPDAKFKMIDRYGTAIEIRRLIGDKRP